MFVFKKILYYTFGRISNGILFVVLGLVSVLIGTSSNLYIFIVIGFALVTLGVVLAFTRESQYHEAISDISKLRKSQRKLKDAVGTLQGKIELLRSDLDEAKSQIDDLKSLKVVDFGKSKHAISGRIGPAFENKETNT